MEDNTILLPHMYFILKNTRCLNVCGNTREHLTPGKMFGQGCLYRVIAERQNASAVIKL